MSLLSNPVISEVFVPLCDITVASDPVTVQRPVCGLYKCYDEFLPKQICVCADVFSQVSDAGGVLVLSKFDNFLREVLKVPAAVNEGPSFGYTHTLARSCFPQQVN